MPHTSEESSTVQTAKPIGLWPVVAAYCFMKVTSSQMDATVRTTNIRILTKALSGRR